MDSTITTPLPGVYPDPGVRVSLRPATQEDYPAIAEIANLCWPDDTSTANELWEREAMPENRVKCARFVAEEDRKVVATARYYQLPGRYHPERFWLEVDVHPLKRNHGLGSALLDHLLNEVGPLGGKLARVALDDKRSREITFLQKRGFLEEWRSWELARTLEDLEPKVLRTEAASILARNHAEVITLAEAFERGLQRDCYRVHETTRQDSSWNDPVTEWGFENYLRSMHQNVTLEASYAGFIKGELVALCALGKAQPNQEDVDHNWTGVLHAYRGRGLARALKKLTLASAKELGYKRVVTTCNSLNKPMITLNEEYGFTQLYAWIYLSYELPRPLTETLTIRSATDSDLPRICPLRNLTLAQPVTPEYMAAMYRSHDSQCFLGKWVIEDEHRNLVAFTQAFHLPNFGQAHFFGIDVQPEWQGQGIGSKLLAFIESRSRQQGAGQVRTYARDDRPETMEFLAKRGFVEYQHLFESVAELAHLDIEGVLAKKLALESTGIRVATYAELGDTTENRHKLHELHNVTDLDTPGAEAWGESPFESFEAHCFYGGRHDPSAIYIALDGDRWIGTSMVYRCSDEEFGTTYTGTLREYRGRGIGAALKGLAMIYAKEQGAQRIRTDNDTRNTPMLAINRKLGFKPQFGWRQMEKELS